MPVEFLFIDAEHMRIRSNLNAAGRARVCWLILLSFLFLSAAESADPQTPVVEWTGAELPETGGAFYLKVALDKFPVKKGGGILAQSIQISFYSILERKEFVVSQVISDAQAPPSQIWQLRAGKYQIIKLAYVDTEGTIRTWQPKNQGKSFVIQRKTLSNLGLLTISPQEKVGLVGKLTMVPDSYKDERAVLDGLLTGVIDAYTGIQQRSLAGDKALGQRSLVVNGHSQMEAAISVTRKISMYFKLDLFKHNQYAKSMLGVLTQHDPSFRACYTDSLRENDQLRGQMKFSLLFSKSLASIKKLNYSGGSLTEPNLVRCLFNELHNLNFPVPANMIGELIFTFDVKD